VRSELPVETAPQWILEYLTTSPELCGALCVCLTKTRSKLKWLSGRGVSVTWDVDGLEAKDEIVEKRH